MAEQAPCFGLVGAGGIAQTYAQAFQTLARAAASSPSPTCGRRRPQALAEALRCPQLRRRYEALAQRRELDAVIVCTPPATPPRDLPITSSSRQVHVLCEKPFAHRLAERPRA